MFLLMYSVFVHIARNFMNIVEGRKDVFIYLIYLWTSHQQNNVNRNKEKTKLSRGINQNPGLKCLQALLHDFPTSCRYIETTLFVSEIWIPS